MAEIKTEVKTYQIDYVCDECGCGYLRPTGEALLTHPPKYPHKCKTCGFKKTFKNKYPTVVTEEALVQ